MTPSGAELPGRAERLRPRLLARQAEAERLRRVPEATMRDFHAAGSRALFAENELQRCFRDVHAVASSLTRLGMIGRTPGGEV
jgi:hypothetical protein